MAAPHPNGNLARVLSPLPPQRVEDARKRAYGGARARAANVRPRRTEVKVATGACRDGRGSSAMRITSSTVSIARRIAQALLALFALAGTAAAVEWPNRPLTLVVPFAAA